MGSSRLGSPILSAGSILARVGTQTFDQSFRRITSSQSRCYKSGKNKWLALFSLVFPQLAFSFSGFSCSSSAAPSIDWASRRLATFSGHTCPCLERAWHRYRFVQSPLQIAWCVRPCGSHVFMGGDPVADCVYLVETGVFWSFFFLGFASVGCSVLLLPIKVNGVYGWLNHTHIKSCSQRWFVWSVCFS